MEGSCSIGLVYFIKWTLLPNQLKENSWHYRFNPMKKNIETETSDYSKEKWRVCDGVPTIQRATDKISFYTAQQKHFVEDVPYELRTPVAIVEGHLKFWNRRWGKMTQRWRLLAKSSACEDTVQEMPWFIARLWQESTAKMPNGSRCDFRTDCNELRYFIQILRLSQIMIRE